MLAKCKSVNQAISLLPVNLFLFHGGDLFTKEVLIELVFNKIISLLMVRRAYGYN